MPVSPKSLANLRPAWTADTAPRGRGWPEWRRQLQGVIGDGGQLFDALMRLARGEAVAVVAPGGKPLIDSETGRQVLLVPSAPVMLGAIRELLDRAFGKPAQMTVDASASCGNALAEAAALGDLTDDERAMLRAIARRRMLGVVPDQAPNE